MLRMHPIFFTLIAVTGVFLLSQIGLASVEGTLSAIESKFVNVILPLAAVLGLVYAAFSFVTGSPQAKTHLLLAVIGAMVGFGAKSIVAFIKGLVN